jgi:hypothetical protein
MKKVCSQEDLKGEKSQKKIHKKVGGSKLTGQPQLGRPPENYNASSAKSRTHP